MSYHTLRHLTECFSHFEPARHLASHPFEVEVALWLHDAIYEPRRTDSEIPDRVERVSKRPEPES